MQQQYYYIQITSTGAVFSLSECLVTGGDIVQNIKVTKEVYEMIGSDKRKYIYNSNSGEWIENPNYEKEKQAEKRAELDELSLTAADVERAIYKAKNIDFNDIITMVEGNPDIDIKALKIELKANNFYRGNPWINQIGGLLGYTEDDLDYLFKNGGLPNKEEPEELKAKDSYDTNNATT